MQNLQKWQLLKKTKKQKRIWKINPWRCSGWISESFPAHRTQPSTLWKSRIPIRVEKVSYGNPSCLSLVSYVPTPLPYTHPLPLRLPTQLCTPNILRTSQCRRTWPQRSPLTFLPELWQHSMAKGLSMAGWFVYHWYRCLQMCCFTFRMRRRKSWWRCANGCWTTLNMETAAWRGRTTMAPKCL